MKYVLIVTIVSLFLNTSCSSSEPITSISEITDAGYYLYVLPGEYMLQREFTMSVSMRSFDAHCGITENYWNPINVLYQSPNERIDVNISPDDPVWNPLIDAQEIILNVDWAENRDLEYYRLDNGGTVIRIKDINGLDIIVSSFMSVNQLTPIISNLTPIGEAFSDLGNPWEEYCNRHFG